MKKRNIFITSALILLAPTVLSLSQQDSQAATKLVGRTNSITSLVDSTGKAVQNRALGKDTDWQLGKIININGNTYYQVATDEYALSTNITVINSDSTSTDTNNNANTDTNTDTTTDKDTDTTKIGTLSYAAKVVDPDGNATGQVLPAGSAWKLGVTKNIDGNDYYQVASNAYVIALAVKINSNDTNSDTNTNTNNNTNTTPAIPMPNNGLVATTNVSTRVYNYADNAYGQTLPTGSAWKVSKLVVNKYGSYWGEIATNQYVWLGDVTINSGLNLKDNSEYIAEFATSINK
ncbi:SLAP domain-containing protein [Companilactobacillus farciminis]|uniref:SLAP domain-containing protein n=1 Tax=Companilactobacillus farciminis TaxID=1612 RepID=UPI001914F6CB|nr:SLAP domain-containing protein [Companilactobacillus farciminis]